MLVNQETFSVLKQLVQENGSIELPAEGNSMFPFIRKGDKCQFVECIPSLLTKGDVVLFYSSSGQLVGHRFIRSELMNRKCVYFFKGDTNLGLDEPVIEADIIGKLVSVKKRKVYLKAERMHSLMWCKTLMTFPWLSGLLRVYLNKKNQLHQ
ncbi:S24/S26 family peptidase [Pseudalkalibacillus hwajinpoensis]|uniref:S24/S26 family peptidase n=1 Tax=Guptibacillus hwajinpoensis TaxID=208199 RepID=UPI00325AB9F1